MNQTMASGFKEKSDLAAQPNQSNKLENQKISSESPKEILIEIKNLRTYFFTEEGVVKAVDGLNLEIFKDEVLGLVGETGCGKSVTALSIIRLIRAPGKIVSGEILLNGQDLVTIPEKEMREKRGCAITMIFQDPLNSLNPVMKIGDQIIEAIMLHQIENLESPFINIRDPAKRRKELQKVVLRKAEDLIGQVGIPDPKNILNRYPHELSGGMRQRIMIAMALSCNPALLIADEPTTALDVTIEAQILDLIKELKRAFKTSILLITHDLGIVAEICDRVAVMYSGKIVEYGSVNELFKEPLHPYTKGLLGAIPSNQKRGEKLHMIRGTVPDLIYPPPGCRFHPRCDFRLEICEHIVPELREVKPNYCVACHLYDPEYKFSPKYQWNESELKNSSHV